MKLKKTVALSLAVAIAVSLAAGLSGCGSGGDSDKKVLNVFTWEEYIPGGVVEDFEKATGIKVNYSSFSTNEEMHAKLQAQKTSYDVVLCSDYIIDILRREDALLELDKAKIPNWKNINPIFLDQPYDPGSKFAMPYTTATGIIAYDSAKIDWPITGYGDLFNPEFKNKVVLIDGDRDVIGFVLQAMGYSVNETDPAVLEEAGEWLGVLRPNVVKFDADFPHEAMISGEAIIGYMFGSQATAARESVPTIEFCYPDEGMTICTDAIVVPKGAPHPENAHTFINYLLDGKVAAKAYSTINYGGTNLAAMEFLPPEYLNNPSFNIPDELLSKAERFGELGDALLIYERIWTKFKSGY